MNHTTVSGWRWTATLTIGDLPRMEQVVVDHIVRFAFREELKFDWHKV